MGNKKRLLIAARLGIERKRLEDAFSALDDIERLPSVDSGRDVLSLVRQKQVDILLLDLVLSDLSGREVLAELEKMSDEERPKIFILTAFADDQLMERWSDIALCCFVKPYASTFVVYRVIQLAIYTGDSISAPAYLQDDRLLENRITKVLNDLGVPPNMRGYAMLRCCIAYYAASDDPSAIQITVEAYPRLAAIFKCDASSVEHAMRSAIEATWTRGSLNAIHAYFGNTIDSMRGKPSNAEFVQRIASQVRIKPTRSFLDMLR